MNKNDDAVEAAANLRTSDLICEQDDQILHSYKRKASD